MFWRCWERARIYLVLFLSATCHREEPKSFLPERCEHTAFSLPVLSLSSPVTHPDSKAIKHFFSLLPGPALSFSIGEGMHVQHQRMILWHKGKFTHNVFVFVHHILSDEDSPQVALAPCSLSAAD